MDQKYPEDNLTQQLSFQISLEARYYAEKIKPINNDDFMVIYNAFLQGAICGIKKATIIKENKK